jgi:hypothetical protein
MMSSNPSSSAAPPSRSARVSSLVSDKEAAIEQSHTAAVNDDMQCDPQCVTCECELEQCVHVCVPRRVYNARHLRVTMIEKLAWQWPV